MYWYLRGALKFRAKEYTSAQSCFEKAIQYNKTKENELLYQYYGQTLLALNHANESFIYLSKAYEICQKKGWKAQDDEEYRLLKGTLDALKYLAEHFDLRIHGFEHDKKIIMK